MTLILDIFFLGLSAYFADEKAAYQAAHEFCPDTFVTRVDDRSHFTCEGVDYVVVCDDGACDLNEWESPDGEVSIGAVTR